MPKRFIWVDPVWGPATFHDREAEVLATAEIARLFDIKQLSTVYLFHPNAIHTRFHHSLGVAALIKFFINSLPTDFLDKHVGLENPLLLVTAGLLHDIGHAAWSHVGEVFPQYHGRKREHDELSARLIEGDTTYDTYFESSLPRVRDVLKDDEAEKIANMIRGNPPISKSLLDKIKRRKDRQAEKTRLDTEFQWMGNIIEGPLDFDTADFLRRDALCTLANPGMVDPYNLASNVGIAKTAGISELVFTDLPFAESFMLASELMYPAVYVESHNLIAEELLLRALVRTYDKEEIDDFWFSTDEGVLDHMKEEGDDLAKRVVGLMRDHTTYQLIADVSFSTLSATTISNLENLFDKRQGLLQLESEVVDECKRRGIPIEVGDVVISTWVWHTEKIPSAKIRAQDGECYTLALLSDLIKTLTTYPAYPRSRSKLVIGTYCLSETQNKTVRNIALSLLNTVKYPHK